MQCQVKADNNASKRAMSHSSCQISDFRLCLEIAPSGSHGPSLCPETRLALPDSQSDCNYPLLGVVLPHLRCEIFWAIFSKFRAELKVTDLR